MLMKPQYMFLLLLILLLIVGVTPSFSQDLPIVVSNATFTVTRVKNNTLTILEHDTKKTMEQAFAFPIRWFEICPTHPYISLTAEDSRTYIYDVTQQRMYEAPLIPMEVSRWSVDGKYTVLYSGVSLAIVKTEELTRYLPITNDVAPYIEIIGHHFGEISHLVWLDSHTLIYETGCCTLMAYGVADLDQKKNYFIAKCRFSEGLCEQFQAMNTLKTYVVEKLLSDELPEMSFNLWEELFKSKK